ncbi:VIT1/CCC1 transporter family protein [Roseivirga pacifica]|uniref:VIT1/CCC1 transporter family protein n=1 Tax=Roseivirga pacifica TaxID=1267423 RepID=UPI003BABC05D
MSKHKEAVLHGESTFLSKFQDYIGEFIYGGIDGSVTTFAVVAGAAGAGLDSSVVIILGFANLIADGFSMSVGSYLSTKSERDKFEKHKRIEYWEVNNIPDAEREEIREIYAAKGFEGDLLEQVVDKITEDKDRWVDVMMKEELEMQKEQKSPFQMGLVTFVSFIIMGFIPLIVYVIDYSGKPIEHLFRYSSILTFITFAAIGYAKSYITATSKVRGILETLFLGGSAAVLAYYVGVVLEGIIS